MMFQQDHRCHRPAEQMLNGVVLRRQLGRPVDVPLELEPVQDLLPDADELPPGADGDGVPFVRLGAHLIALHCSAAALHRLLDEGSLGVGARSVVRAQHHVVVGAVRRTAGEGAANLRGNGSKVDGLGQTPQELAVFAQLKIRKM